MKRRIALLLLSLAMLTMLAVPTFATIEQETTVVTELTEKATLSEDLQQVQMGGETYVHFNSSQLVNWPYDVVHFAELSETQQQSIKHATVWFYNCPVLRVDIEYLDGAKLELSYIREDLKAHYEELLTADQATVDFRNPEGNTVQISLDKACGKEEILFAKDYYNYSWFDVEIEGQEGLTVYRGRIGIYRDEYYFDDANVLNVGSSYTKVWRITDEALCAQIDSALEAYYGSDFGWVEDEDFSDQISKVFLIILFVVLPSIALIVFLILAIRAKTPVYKKLFWNLCVWSALVLIVVGTVALVVQLN